MVALPYGLVMNVVQEKQKEPRVEHNFPIQEKRHNLQRNAFPLFVMMDKGRSL